MHFPDEDLCMALGLNGVFSYSPSKKPEASTLNDYDNQNIFLTISNINPHNKIYSENERAIIDYEGNMIEKRI